MVSRKVVFPATVILVCLSFLPRNSAFAQEATLLPGVVVDTNTPPSPISNPSSRDPGPAAQARRSAQRSQQQASASAQPVDSIGSTPAGSPAADDGGSPTVVTPGRTSQSLGTVATATTVIGPVEIERARGAGASVADVLRGSPGLNVQRSGGVGGTTDVRIRGADSDQTLVMIDGVRLNDPASAQSEFDFSVLSLSNVDRIEILRGPQSGVYGGDAIGGVINIITRTGEGPPSSFVEAEGGSFGTLSQKAGSSGSVGRFSYAIGLSNFATDGFSRKSGGTEDDATEKQSIAGTFGYRLSDDADLKARLGYYRVSADLDGSVDDKDEVTRELFDAALTATMKSFGGIVTTRGTVFANQTDRIFFDDTTTDVTSDFEGTRVGFELQSDVKIGERDLLTIGGKTEAVSGSSIDTTAAGIATDRFDETDHQYAVFASYLFIPVDAFTLSAAGRLDDFDNGNVEATYRFAAAYRFDETGTKLRASYGTGAKAPTIFQRAEASFGNPDLEVETSEGFDIGIDQLLLNGRVELSATYFRQDIENLIVFETTSFDPFDGEYRNVASAETEGVEFAAQWQALDWLRLRGAYTYLKARDAELNEPLPRRPEHVAKATIELQPTSRLYFSGTVIYQSDQFGSSGRRNPVDGFTRIDANAEYNFSDAATVFIRAENLTDNTYEEVFSFATPDRSAYAGIRLRF